MQRVAFPATANVPRTESLCVRREYENAYARIRQRAIEHVCWRKPKIRCNPGRNRESASTQEEAERGGLRKCIFRS